MSGFSRTSGPCRRKLHPPAAQREDQRRRQHQRAADDVQAVDPDGSPAQHRHRAERRPARRRAPRAGWPASSARARSRGGTRRARTRRGSTPPRRARRRGARNESRSSNPSDRARGRRTSAENREWPVPLPNAASSRRRESARRRAPSSSSPGDEAGRRRPVRSPRFQPSDVKSAMATVRQKKISARPACAVEIAVGRKKRTVSPPRSPCRMTAPSAARPSRFIQRRGSAHPQPGGQHDREKPDGARDQTMTVLVEDAADPFRGREQEHVLAVRRRPVGHGQPRARARDETARQDEDDRAAGDERGELVQHSVRQVG